jgi:S-(hydroxymethyl)glutathione dehydrogenase/alcohol dehydrogenase
MKAAVLRQIPSSLEIAEIELDTPGPHEVLLKVAAAGVCHSDLHFIEGKYPHPTPVVMGHESAGVVEAVGDQVTYVQPGDHVITCLSVFCGECEFCLSGRPSLCQSPNVRRSADDASRITIDGGTACNQFAGMGSFAEKMLVHERGVVKIRDDMPLDRAALIGCGVTTGLGAALRTARVEPGSTVAVIGCGGVGLSAIQGSAIAGAGRVIAVDRIAAKLDLALKLGATHTVNASEGDPVAQVMEMTGGGVDYSFEAIGLKIAAQQAFAMLKRGGTATIIGMIPFGETIELPGYEFLMEKKIQGSMMGSNRFRVDMPRFVDFYLDGRLKLDEMLSSRITLDEVNNAMDALSRGEVARQVIMFD